MSAPRARIVFAGGGTGGHLYPALAVVEALRALPSSPEVLFLGSVRPLERRLLGAAGQQHLALPTAPWPGARRLHQGVRFLSSQLKGVRAARRVLSEFEPQVVVGLGGFPSVGPVLAARSLKIPAALLEPSRSMKRPNSTSL